MQATVGAAALDYAQVLLTRTIVLTNVPTGTMRVVFSEADFGNFLVHPLVTEAAKSAVKVGTANKRLASECCLKERYFSLSVHPLATEAAKSAVKVRGIKGACRERLSGKACRGAGGCNSTCRERIVSLLEPTRSAHTRTHAQPQGAPFVFDRESVRIEPPSASRPEGAIFFTGTARADGARYQVRVVTSWQCLAQLMAVML